MSATTGAGAGAGAVGTLSVAGLLAAACVPNVLVNVNSSAISVLIPAIADDTGATIDSLQWTVSGYSLVSAASIVAAGAMADRIGRRIVFLFGLFVFAACSVLVALSTTGLGVVLARSAQGLAAAIAVSGSLVLLSVTLPPERRLFGTTMWAASAAIGAAIGPLLGGALAELGGWGGVFWVSAIGMLACVPLVLRFVPESRAAEQAGARFDWWGVALLAIAMSMLILYATYAADIGWLSLAGVGVLVAMVASTIAFLAVERRVDAPLVDLGLLRNQPFVVATLALVVFNCTFTAFVLGLQLYLQQPFGPGMSALQSGAALLPAVVVMLVASALVTRVSTRIGVHTTIVAGFVLLGAGLLAAAPLDASWTIAWFLPCLVLVGIGGALANGPVTAVATGSVDADQAGSAAGVNNMARYLGTAIAAPIATGIYMGVATSRTTDTLEGLGATDAADRSEQLVGASGSGALDALQRLPDATADAVHDGVGAAISAGMATLSVVLAAMCVIPVLLFVLPGRRRAADPEPGFDSATAPAAHAHTIPRLRRFGARARAGRGRG